MEEIVDVGQFHSGVVDVPPDAHVCLPLFLFKLFGFGF
jgi:hypothetical protein